MSKDKEPPKTWVGKLSKEKVAANSDNQVSKGRSLGKVDAASSSTPTAKNVPSPERIKKKAIKKPPSKWVDKENIPKPSKPASKKEQPKRVVRPPASSKVPSENKSAVKAPAKRQVRPPGSKVNVAPVKKAPTIKKAPKISRGPKR